MLQRLKCQGYFAFAFIHEKSLLVDLVQEDQGIYATMVKNMIQEGRYRLVVNINDLRRKNPARAVRYAIYFVSSTLIIYGKSCKL